MIAVAREVTHVDMDAFVASLFVSNVAESLAVTPSELPIVAEAEA